VWIGPRVMQGLESKLLIQEGSSQFFRPGREQAGIGAGRFEHSALEPGVVGARRAKRYVARGEDSGIDQRQFRDGNMP